MSTVGGEAPGTTVVLPAWDAYAADLLPQALASVLAQRPQPEILIVDNASEPPLADIGEARVLRTPRRLSVGAARNFGLAHVGTPLVVFWDADDAMFPETLASLEAAIGSDPDLVAFGAAIIEEPSGQRHRWPRRWIKSVLRFRRLFALLDAVWSLYPTTGATIMRTQAVREAGGYSDSDSGEDWCLGVSLAFRGRLGWTERPGRVYRIHPTSVWARHMTVPHQLQHAQTVRQRIAQDAGIPAWAKKSLPLITLGQYAAILVHAGVPSARRIARAALRPPGRAAGPE